jgi:hypothetical protein
MNKSFNSKMPDPGNMKVAITSEMVANAPTVTCDCGGIVFSEKLVFKKMSALISPSGKEEMFPLNAMICEKCGKVPSIFDPNDMFPKELKATKNKLEL